MRCALSHARGLLNADCGVHHESSRPIPGSLARVRVEIVLLAAFLVNMHLPSPRVWCGSGGGGDGKLTLKVFGGLGQG